MRPELIPVWVQRTRTASILGTLALIALCVLWETALAPLRPGSLLWMKAVPLLFPLAGLIRGRRYTYQWMSMFVLAWFIEGVMRAWGDHGLSAWLAGTEILVTCWIFIAVILFARLTRQ